mgnify:CR=1 FL=1
MCQGGFEVPSTTKAQGAKESQTNAKEGNCKGEEVMGERNGRREQIDRMVSQMVKGGAKPSQAQKIATREAKKADRDGK